LSNYNPYSPPQHDDDQRYALGGNVSWDGKLLLVPKQFSFPRICLKCASPEVHSRRTQKFGFTPTWARLLVVVCWPAAVVAMALTTKRATLELPLCDPCHARWLTARKWSIALAIGIFVVIFGVAFGGAASGSESEGLLLPIAILVLVLGMAFGVNKLVRPHTLQAKKIEDVNVTLAGVNPTAGEQVARSSR
jgi:hypothetical protein